MRMRARKRGRDRNPLMKGLSLEGLKHSLKMQKQIHLHRYFSQGIANYHNKDDVGGIAGGGDGLQEHSLSYLYSCCGEIISSQICF